MTSITKNTFTLPNLGTMFHALNKGSAKKAGTAQSTDGVLVPCQWDSLSDVRRHRPSKYVHQIRLVESPGALELRMMHFKAQRQRKESAHRRIERSHAQPSNRAQFAGRSASGALRCQSWSRCKRPSSLHADPGRQNGPTIRIHVCSRLGGCILVKAGDGTSPIFDAYNVQKARHERPYGVHEYYG